MLRSLVVALSVVLLPAAALASDPEHGLYIDLGAGPMSQGFMLYVGPGNAMQLRTGLGGVKVTLDGQQIGDAKVTVNGTPMVQDMGPGSYTVKRDRKNPVVVKDIGPGKPLKVEAEAGGKKASVTVTCPTDVAVVSPKENAPVKPQEVVKVTYKGTVNYAQEFTNSTAKIVPWEKALDETRPGSWGPGFIAKLDKDGENTVEIKASNSEGPDYLLWVDVPGKIEKSADGQMRCTLIKRVRLAAKK